MFAPPYLREEVFAVVARRRTRVSASRSARWIPRRCASWCRHRHCDDGARSAAALDVDVIARRGRRRAGTAARHRLVRRGARAAGNASPADSVDAVECRGRRGGHGRRGHRELWRSVRRARSSAQRSSSRPSAVRRSRARRGGVTKLVTTHPGPPRKRKRERRSSRS